MNSTGRYQQGNGVPGSPPAGSTGVEMTTGVPGRLGIGWAQGTTHSTSTADVLGWLSETFGQVVPRETGLQWYRRSWRIGTAGVMVGDGPRSGTSNPAEVYVVIPQAALEPLGWTGQLGTLALLSSLGVRLSRLDVNYDDLSRVADPADVLEALEAGQTRSHARAWRVVRDSSGGMTTYIGARTGEMMVRVYRKWVESKDPTQGVRWEAECKGERAGLVADLITSSDRPGVTFFELLRSFVDFVAREEGQRGDRAPFLAWWAALVRDAGRATLALKVVGDSFARRLAWLRRQVAPTLAEAFVRGGSGLISALIGEGMDRRGVPVLVLA
jgi:DNA relaxase NicK